MTKNRRILVVEDSSVIQSVSKTVLEFQDFDVDVAKNGEEAIEKIKETDYSIILMDIIMPKMNGIECAKRVRALKDVKKSKTPILAVTGNIRNYSLEDFQSFGINDFVEKPVDFDRLLPKLNSMINA
jgi:CheY-like chemotaxis protein